MNNRFDQEASQWDQQDRRVKMAAGIADAMSGVLQLGPARDLLDFGAGTGLVSLKLQPRCPEIDQHDAVLHRLVEIALGQRLGRHVNSPSTDFEPAATKRILRTLSGRDGSERM